MSIPLEKVLDLDRRLIWAQLMTAAMNGLAVAAGYNGPEHALDQAVCVADQELAALEEARR